MDNTLNAAGLQAGAAPGQGTDEANSQQQSDVATQPQASALPDDWKGFFKDLLRKCELEDDFVHYNLVRKIRRLNLYFNNLVDLFWDEFASDWKVPDWEALEQEGVPPRIINHYRPHAESIIAALSMQVPNIVFFPGDAENPDDIDTAENFTNAGLIIQAHNKYKLLLIKALTILFNEGTVFAYTYNKRDRKFGYFSVEDSEVINQDIYEHTCPVCGYDFGQAGPDPIDNVNCQDCGNTVTTEVEHKAVPTTQPNTKQKEKIHTFIDLAGVTNIKVPYHAKTSEHVGYLIYKFDYSIAALRSIFCEPGPNGESPLLETLEAKTTDTGNDSWTRYPTIYQGALPQNTAVVKLVWYTPWQLSLISGENNDAIIKAIREKYPTGAFVTYINDEAVEVYEEDLHDHWTISYDPRAMALHGEPGGTGLATIQDILAELVELKLQTIEHGISEVFVDSGVLDFEKYKNQMAKPGNLTQVQSDGRPVAEKFFETRTATLSPEFAIVEQYFNQMAEFVTGDLPQIYGGQVDSQNETLGAYQSSKNQALNRLSTMWTIVSYFFSDVLLKAVREYTSSIEYIENYSVKAADGTFQNVSVNPAMMSGVVGRAEPEFSDQLPLSWAQQQAIIQQLMLTKDPNIMGVLMHPDNAGIMKKVIGIPGFYIPGDKDRNEQLAEINQLLQGSPVGPQQSSIPPNPYDDDDVHVEICEAYMKSAKGRYARQSNPKGFDNVMLHWGEHKQRQAEKQATMPQPPQTAKVGVS